MVLYVENPKDSTKKKRQNKTELISEFSKLARHIINTQQSIMFLIMKTKLWENTRKSTRCVAYWLGAQI